MTKEVYIPKMGQTVEEVTIVSFLVEDGTRVSEGDEILEVETDKAVFGIEAEVDGFVHFGPFKLHDVVPILTVVAVIGKEDDVFSAAGKSDVSITAPQKKEKSTSEPVKEPAQPEMLKENSRRQFISPRAKKLAEKHGLDLSLITATGAGGQRIQEKDVLRYLEQLPDATPVAKRIAQTRNIDLSQISPAQPGGKISKQDVEEYLAAHLSGGRDEEPQQVTHDKEMTGIRRIIAEKMLASSRQTAPVTLFMDADAGVMVKLRETKKASAEDGKAAGFNEIIARIVAKTMETYPYMNARITGDRIQWLQDIHIGIAVDTERGLVVPVVKNANRLGVDAIFKEFIRLLNGIRSAKSTPDDLIGGTFTITNLGAYDVRAFTPIINLPESAILGLGKIEDRVVPSGDGIRIRKMMTLSLTFDHRLVDGAPAARFLQAIKNGIEHMKPEDLE
ncbi:MAG: 2-oxo acid dehydrogenase subunit E2 [Anaerolineales bacterium]|nr:2-oxo acid dehydrogenase subunit E2 [Anaerolineales bacterium]